MPLSLNEPLGLYPSGCSINFSFSIPIKNKYGFKTGDFQENKLVGGWDKEGNYRKLQEGGLVTETGMAMLHGTVPKPELVLDNQAAALFMEAAMIIKGIGLSSGKNLMDLQRDKAAVGGMAVTTVVNNTNSQQINQNQAMVLPPSPIIAGNGESTLSTA